jgi:hypothetical protein
VTTKLEHLRVAVDAFLDFLGVVPGTQEEHLWNAHCRVLDAIESDVRHGTRVALAMAEVSVEADLTGVLHPRCLSLVKQWFRVQK